MVMAGEATAEAKEEEVKVAEVAMQVVDLVVPTAEVGTAMHTSRRCAAHGD